MSGCGPGGFVKGALHHDRLHAAHRGCGQEAISTVSGYGAVPTTDMQKPFVTEACEVLDRELRAGGFISTDDVEVWRPPTDKHHRVECIQRHQLSGRQLGAQHQQGLAAGVHEHIDCPLLTGSSRHGMKQHLVASVFGGVLHSLCQLGVERVADRQGDTKQASASRGEATCGPVGAVAEVCGGRTYTSC